MTFAVAASVLSLGIWLYLLAGRGGFWRVRLPRAVAWPKSWPAVAVVVPARDEAENVGEAIGSLLGQHYGGRLAVVLVDDHSSDGTAAMASRVAAALGKDALLGIVTAPPLPTGWSGKLWAVAAGLERAREILPEAGYVLLTDADIVHGPEVLAGLVARAEAKRLDLVSLMVRLRCRSLAERLLVPAYVFFFRLIYPFAWVNDPRRAVAAAAGGCMLVRNEALRRIGGIGAIRTALIDDCALAQAIKPGGPIWIGLATDSRSIRRYESFGDIWRLVARNAYTQLGHSPRLLAVSMAGLLAIFVAPPLIVPWGGWAAVIPAGISCLAMAVAYMPILRFYHRSLVWLPLLPLVALFYAGATLDSARNHYRGRGGEWKGRVQDRRCQ